MKYMISWKIAPGFHKTTMETFLKSGAPLPQGAEFIGRWHAPGSPYGWLLMESADITTIAEHIAQWASLIEFEVTPVIDDDLAGQALSRVYGASP